MYFSSLLIKLHPATASSAVKLPIDGLHRVHYPPQDDAMWEDWLAAVMRLLLGFPLTVQLPKDKLGNPDFMDCW